MKRPKDYWERKLNEGLTMEDSPPPVATPPTATPREEPCGHCGGDGWDLDLRQCPDCKGTGRPTATLGELDELLTRVGVMHSHARMRIHEYVTRLRTDVERANGDRDALRSEVMDFCRGHVESVPDKEGQTWLEVGGAIGWGCVKHYPTFFEYAVPLSAEEIAEREKDRQRRIDQRDEVAYLRDDAARLDWLEKNAGRWSLAFVALRGKWRCEGSEGDEEWLLDERFPTARHAIDAAMTFDAARASSLKERGCNCGGSDEAGHKGTCPEVF